MLYPTLTPRETTRTAVTRFGGYNHTESAGEQELYWEENLSSRAYPLLATRPPRAKWQEITHDNQLYGKIDKTLALATYGEDILRITELLGEVSLIRNRDTQLMTGLSMDGPKSLVIMGAYACIFPDGVYCNLEDPSDQGTMGASLSILADSEAQFGEPLFEGFTLQPCTADGSVYPITSRGDTPPEDPADGACWLDQSGEESILKQYSAATNIWVVIPTTYILVNLIRRVESHVSHIVAFRLTDWFSDGDRVRITGLTGVDATVDQALVKVNARSFVLAGTLPDGAASQTADVTLERRVPLLDYVIQADNRLWGCRYGADLDGNMVNALYACKLGDPRNWFCYAGAASDSYAVSLGVEGAFTGAVLFDGYPTFFKAQAMIRVQGSYPAAYALSTQRLPGVQAGSSGSLAEVGGCLYYHSAAGVMVYDGSAPRCISANLGRADWQQAVGGCLGDCYYLSMETAAGEPHLFCYDTLRGLWHREDATRAVAMAPLGSDLLVLKRDSDGGEFLSTLGGSTPGNWVEWDAAGEGDFPWQLVTGRLGDHLPENRYLGRLGLRLRLGRGARVSLYVQYDDGPFRHLKTMVATADRSFPVPVLPRRCDRLRLKLEGVGPCTLLALTETLEEGSDIP